MTQARVLLRSTNEPQKAKVAESSTPKAKPKPKPAAAKPAVAASNPTSSASTTPEATPKKTVASNTTPRKRKKEPILLLNSVEREANTPLQIEVKFEGDSAQAQPISEGVYGHTLKLQASSAFTLCKTVCHVLRKPIYSVANMIVTDQDI